MQDWAAMERCGEQQNICFPWHYWSLVIAYFAHAQLTD